MTADLPDYFFRTREGGASVFRVDGNNRNRRLEMEQIASINMRSGEIRPNGERTLLEEDLEAIKTWIADRKETLEWRQIDDILRTVDRINETAHWAQTKASADQIDMVTDSLLMAMHDLRSVLVRKKAQALEKASPPEKASRS